MHAFSVDIDLQNCLVKICCIRTVHICIPYMVSCQPDYFCPTSNMFNNLAHLLLLRKLQKSMYVKVIAQNSVRSRHTADVIVVQKFNKRIKPQMPGFLFGWDLMTLPLTYLHWLNVAVTITGPSTEVTSGLSWWRHMALRLTGGIPVRQQMEEGRGDALALVEV